MNDKFLNGPVSVSLIKMATPAALGMLMTFMFQLVDIWFVGQLGSSELAAVSFTFPVYFLFVSFFMGTASGVAATVAKALGEGNQFKATRLIYTAAVTFVAFTCVIGLLAYQLVDPIFSFLGASEELQPLTRTYMQPLFIGMFALVGGLIGNSALMAKGVMVKASGAMALGGLTNLILDYVLIFGMGPIPAYGLAGAAWATVISWGVILLMMMALLVQEKLIHLGGPRPAPITTALKKKVLLREIMTLALPAIAAQMLIPLATAIVTRLVSGFGAEAVAAFGIVSRIETLGLTGVFALSVILTPFAAQNYGASNHQRLRHVLKAAISMAVFWGLGLAIILFTFAENILAIFTDNSAIISAGVTYFHLVGLSVPCMGILVVTSAFFNGVYRSKTSLSITISRAFLFTVPFAIAGAFYSLNGIWIALASANLASSILAYFHIRRWRQIPTPHSSLRITPLQP